MWQGGASGRPMGSDVQKVRWAVVQTIVSSQLHIRGLESTVYEHLLQKEEHFAKVPDSVGWLSGPSVGGDSAGIPFFSDTGVIKQTLSLAHLGVALSIG